MKEKNSSTIALPKDKQTVLAEADKQTKALAKVTPVIETEEQYLKAAAMLKDVTTLIKKIDEVFDPMLDAAKLTAKLIKDEKAKHINPVKVIDESLRSLISEWMTKKEKKRLLEQAKLDAIAEKKQAKLDAKNEEREAQGLAPSQRVVQKQVAPEVEKGALSFRETWDYEVIDQSLVPAEYWVIDYQKIGTAVRLAKADTNIPGIRAFCTKTPIVR